MPHHSPKVADCLYICSMHKPVFLLLVALPGWLSCSPRFAKTFEEQWVRNGMYTEVDFERIRLVCTFPGDVEISTSKQEIRQAIDGRGYRNILLYGKTSIEPYYEIFVLQDPADVPSFDLVCDTLFYGKHLVIGGNGLADPIPVSDFRFILDNLKVFYPK